MDKLFSWNSPLVKLMTQITNLICPNVLWLVCCLPVILFLNLLSGPALYFVEKWSIMISIYVCKGVCVP